MPEKLADELTKGLREEGVQASVNVSIKRFYNLLITVTGKPCNGCKTSLKQETERAQVKEHLWRRAVVETRDGDRYRRSSVGDRRVPYREQTHQG